MERRRSFTNKKPLQRKREGGGPASLLVWDEAVRWASTNGTVAPVQDDHCVTTVLTHGLNARESAIWLRLLSGVPIATVAQRYRMSTAAMRAAIEAPGGMRTKNPWVARWWQARCQLQLP